MFRTLFFFNANKIFSQDKEPRFHRLTNGNKKGSGRSTQIKSLAVRLTGKKGRMRNNVMVRPKRVREREAAANLPHHNQPPHLRASA